MKKLHLWIYDKLLIFYIIFYDMVSKFKTSAKLSGGEPVLMILGAFFFVFYTPCCLSIDKLERQLGDGFQVEIKEHFTQTL